ncbi:MAG: peroxiredoxin [Conexivisphaerales archaeon]
MLNVGEQIPNVKLLSEEGNEVELASFLGKKLVIYFYPKDGSPGCTKEACEFRNEYSKFMKLGAEIIGISGDGPDSHRFFKSKNSLPFILLSDAKGEARRAFRIGKTLGLIDSRVTFVVDEKGKVQYTYNSQFRPQEHIRRALEFLSK